MLETIDPATTAWLLISTALVLLMTPGLALFYGGMVRSKGVLNMIMMSFISIALVTVVWLVAGYSLAFGDDLGGGLIGGLEHLGMAGITPDTARSGVPEFLFATFQLTFAILTAALISGAIADRAKFSSWMFFVPVWALLVYVPVAHWVWGPDGWISKLGVLDYAGGLVVEIVSGASALALALVLGPRIGFRNEPMRPHNLPMVLLGVGLLWFGWFGFNAGSALAVNDGNVQLAAISFVNTMAAPAAAMASWLAYEKLRHGSSTTLGAASGAVAGLVAITPCAGFVTPLASIAIGLVAGALSAACLGLKEKAKVDDALDVVAVHLIGGLWGSLAVGLFATSSVNPIVTDPGLLVGGGATLLGKQVVAVVAAIAFSFIGTFVLGKLIGLVLPHRVDIETEITGLDQAMHSETAYELGDSSHATSGRDLLAATAAETD